MQSEKVPYYILDLLQQVPSVYVPGLGRFEAIFHPAVIDLQQSQIKPPYVQPDFIARTESEEDILPSYMHYVSGMDINEAKETITSFVSDVMQHVGTAESYSIEKFGVFSLSATEVLHFTPDWDAFNLSFSGLEIIDIHPVQVLKQTQKYPEPVIAIPDVIKPIIESNEENEVTSGLITDSTLSDTQEDIIPSDPAEISEATTRLAWIILTSALILIAVLCAYLAWDIISDRKKINQLTQLYPDTLSTTKELDIQVNKDTLKTHTDNTSKTRTDSTPMTKPVVEPDTLKQPVKEEPVKEQPVKEEPIVKESEIKDQPVKEEPIVKESEIKDQPGSPCFVVVGAFTNPDNVTRMVQRLEGLGYKSTEITGGSLTRVAIRTSCDKENLLKILNEARSGINPESWIY